MNLRILFLQILSILSLFCHSKIALAENGSRVAPSYNYNAMAAFLKTIKEQNNLPERPVENFQMTVSPKPLPQDVKDIFMNLELQIFGTQNLVRLQSCSDCEFITDYATKTVFARYEAIAQIKNSYSPAAASLILKFVFAHELSHLVHEASIGKDRFNLTLNGNISLYGSFIFNNNEEAQAALQLIKKSHSEVDAYALVVLRQSLDVIPSALITYSEDAIRDEKLKGDAQDKVRVTDMQYRLDQMKAIITELWPTK